MSMTRFWLTATIVLSFAAAIGCGKAQIREEGASVPPAAQPDADAAATPASRDVPPVGTGAEAPAPVAPPATAATAVAPSGPDLQRIHFDYDQALLGPEAREILTSNAAYLSRVTAGRVRVEGHCDERGTGEYNLALGERRAQNARQYLVDLGVDAARLEVVTYGEEVPLESGHNEVAWAQNRRVEFIATRP